MVRILVQNGFSEDAAYIEAAGLSTDTKPVEGIVTGSLFLEVDTGDVYAFAEGDSPAWNQIAALGGGS